MDTVARTYIHTWKYTLAVVSGSTAHSPNAAFQILFSTNVLLVKISSN